MNKLFGKHSILDLYGINQIDPDKLEHLLQQAVLEAGATIISSFFHKFPGGGEGRTGVIVLAESHLSIHTWPEDDFAAIDVFMCGNCDPKISIEFILDKLRPYHFEFVEMQRGLSNGIPTGN